MHINIKVYKFCQWIAGPDPCVPQKNRQYQYKQVDEQTTPQNGKHGRDTCLPDSGEISGQVSGD
jgi:hypothetical protein